MGTRKLHKVVGLILLLPFIAWTVTGVIFFVKPGYEGAYEQLQIVSYPTETPVTIEPESSWLEFRYFSTILGEHLLVRTLQGWGHLDPDSQEERSRPSEEEIRLLVHDVIRANQERYGEIVEIDGLTAVTTTGKRITLSWDSMRIHQRGDDTDLIDNLYRIHYLQWTGIEGVDRYLGMVGLAFVVLLCFLGVRLAFSSRSSR